MNPVTFQSQQVDVKNVQTNRSSSNGASSNFKSFLNQSILNGNQGMINKQTIGNAAFENSLTQANLFSDFEVFLTELLALLEQLADEIPFADGYLKPTDLIGELLNELPEELSMEILSLFQSNMSIDELLERIKDSQEPYDLVAAILFFQQLQATGQVQFTASQQQALTSQMQQIVGKEGVELPLELKQLINRLIQQANEQTQSNKQTTTSSFVDQTTLSNQKTGSQGISLQTFAAQEQTALNRQETSFQGLSLQTFAHEQTVMSREQQMTIHVGEQQTKEAEHQQFQRQFQEMINRGVFRNLQNGVNQLSIRLFPEHLGRLDIQITQMNGIITARIMASTQAARELIEGQLQNLRQAFAHQQLQVEKIEVTQQEQAPLYQSAREEQNSRQQHQQSKDNKVKETPEDQETFADFLEEFTFMEKV